VQKLDIEINDQPLVELGDLIFIDNMMSGITYQVIYVNRTILVDDEKKKFEYHRLGLYNMKSYRLDRTFRTEVELNRFIEEHLGAITIRKQKDYIWSLRRKA
jgi:hypothetical protein